MARPTADSLARRVARRIAAARRSRGLTQDALAEALGIATRNLQRMEGGGQNLTLETIERVAEALGADAETLLPSAPAVLLPPMPSGRPPALVPVVELEAAAGLLSASRSVRAVGYCVVDEPRGEELFACPVQGDSMAPLIPPGSLALFRASSGALARGAVHLWQHREAGDPDDGGSFLVKRYAGKRTLRDGRVRISLASDNPRFAPQLFELDDAERLRPLARFVRVVSAIDRSMS
jgi:UDP-N-acetylglucosamine 1-carboxyvinyltransferase